MEGFTFSDKVYSVFDKLPFIVAATICLSIALPVTAVVVWLALKAVAYPLESSFVLCAWVIGCWLFAVYMAVVDRK